MSQHAKEPLATRCIAGCREAAAPRAAYSYRAQRGTAAEVQREAKSLPTWQFQIISQWLKLFLSYSVVYINS